MEMCLTNARFRGMFWAQFLGALNDNVFKNALVILVLYRGWTIGSFSPEQFAIIAGAVFILPFLLFSAWGGQIADRKDKAAVVRGLKTSEIGVALLATVGLLTQHGELLLAALFGFATQSAFFGPAKYSILPELLEPEELLGGNAIVESGTSLAILFGTMLGGALAASHPTYVAVAIIIISLAGRFMAISIPSTPPKAQSRNISWFKANAQSLSLTWQTLPMFLSIMGISWFWFFGAICLTVVPLYSKDVLHGTEHVTTLLLAAYSVGIGVGSQGCEKLSNGRMELGWVPIGSLGMTLFALDFSMLRYPEVASRAPMDLLQDFTCLRMLFDLCGLAICAGLFIVPLYTFIQKRSAAETRSRLIAGSSLWNSMFIIASSFTLLAARHYGITLPQVFFGIAILNILVALAAYRKLPEFTLRLFVVLICKICYKLKVYNAEAVPEEGACVIVANHVTLVDWLFLASATDRPARFVMYHTYYNMPLAHYIFRDGGAIPIGSGRTHPEILEQAFESIHEALQDDQLVIIFPEGKLTTDGEMDTFRKGVEKILERDPVPVLPMALRNLWGTRWSKSEDRRFHWRPLIELVVGEMMPASEANAPHLEEKVTELLQKPVS